MLILTLYIHIHASDISNNIQSILQTILPSAKSQNCSFLYQCHLINDGPVINQKFNRMDYIKKRYCTIFTYRYMIV